MEYVLEQIKEIGAKYKVEKIILFGSRARGDNTSISDYDIAILGNELSDYDKASLRAEIDEVETLKKIDLVFIGQNVLNDLSDNITRDGVSIYEQVKDKIN